jgi:probable rRNA maturation factor
MLDLVVDAEVRALAPWRVRLRREVSRMVSAAARSEADALAAVALSTDPQRRKVVATGPRGPRAPELEVSLRLTNDARIRELNREFRGKNKPTDVLAFAQREGPWAGAGSQLLGDIVISMDTASRQAKRTTAIGLLREVRFLACHGLCHLLGYDHRNDDEERSMNARMAALLRQANGHGRIRAA